MTNAPAGWYPDPEYPGQQRYWDGSSWTIHRAPVSGTSVRNETSSGAASADGNTQATLALVLAILGFVLGTAPYAAWFAWLLFVPALVLAIRSLTRHRGGRGLSIAAVIVLGAGWLTSLVVGLVSVGLLSTHSSSSTAGAPSTGTASAAPSTAQSATPSPVPTEGESSSPSAAPAPAVGQTVTSRSGVGFTVTGVHCGLGAQDDAYETVAPKGEFCRVDFVVANGSAQPQDISRGDIYGYIASSRYETDYELGRFGNDLYSTTVNPGLSVECSVFFDVPPGASLDRVKLITDWWGGDGASVTLK